MGRAHGTGTEDDFFDSGKLFESAYWTASTTASVEFGSLEELTVILSKFDATE